MRVSTTLIGGCAALLVLGSMGMASAAAAEGTPTFAKDIAPILYENCVACHRPNHLAPMSLITYSDARPWARAVKTKVLAAASLSRTMSLPAADVSFISKSAT